MIGRLRPRVRQGLTLVSVGLALGLIGAAGASRLLSRLLYGVSPTDPLAFIVVVVLAAAALLASLIPARRAARVDPMVALRGE